MRKSNLMPLSGLFFAGVLLAIVLSFMFPRQIWTAKTPEQVYQVLQREILPKIQVEQVFVRDEVAARYATDRITEPLPNLEDFPLYGAKPTNDTNTVYLEIFSSAEKSDATKQDARWLVDVADAFNRSQVKSIAGQVIQVGIRNIPSGIGARMIAEKAAKPTGYTPSNHLWLELLQTAGVKLEPVTDQLVPNYTGLVVQSDAYQELAKAVPVTFERLIETVLAGKLTVGYPNPYSSSSSLNLLYTLLWRAAGHHHDKKPLTTNELQLPQVNSLFNAFQNQVITTTVTTLDLQEIFIRDQRKLQIFPLDYQSYAGLKKLPGFEQTGYVPFGVPHNSPLVGFTWNTPVQRNALKKFAQFATSTEMQQVATQQNFVAIDSLRSKDLPPEPKGDVLKAAQSFWKRQKDAGRTVHMMIVVDTSGSMDGNRIQAVKTGLQVASKEINRGNFVGLMTFSDQVYYMVPLAPFDQLQHQRLLAATDSLVADGNTALYDGTMAALGELLAQKQKDPNGRFYLLLLTDGEVTKGFNFEQVKNLLANSGVRIYPIAYGEVNQQELLAIASLREATVQQGTPQNVERLLKELFQTNL